MPEENLLVTIVDIEINVWILSRDVAEVLISRALTTRITSEQLTR